MAAAPFPLSDSSPDSPEFRKRFLGSYGINEAIEPKLTSQDKTLYEQVAPLIGPQPQQAIELILPKIKPDSNSAFSFLLGNLYYQVRDFNNAEKHLIQAVEKFPSFRRAYRTLALIQVQRAQYSKAVAPLLKVVELGGGDAQIYGLLGYAYMIDGKYESGLAAYRMARMFKPDSVDFRRGQAHCLLSTQQTEASIALFDELITEQPEVTDFWLFQANGFLATEQRLKAIANLEIAAGLGRSDWNVLVLLGDLYLGEGIVHLALDGYQRALKGKRSTNWNALLKPLEQLLERRFYNESRSYYTTLQEGENPPPNADSENRLALAAAKIEMQLGDPQKAIAALEAAVKKDPLNGDAWLLLGEHYHLESDFEQAVFSFERALAVPAFQHNALVSLGQTAVAKGDLRGAVKYLREAEQIKSNPNIRNYLNFIQERLGTED